jgi:hypothetical protein
MDTICTRVDPPKPETRFKLTIDMSEAEAVQLFKDLLPATYSSSVAIQIRNALIIKGLTVN